MESKVKGFSRKILNDKHKYLIDLLNGVKNGYDLPEKITEEEYKYIKEHKDDDPVLTGFVGFGCSFGESGLAVMQEIRLVPIMHCKAKNL